ncbi:ATP-binding protein [Streptomyces sp. NPDC002306]
MAHWRGDVDVAARVAGHLVDNAVRHGRPLGDGCVRLCLGVIDETDELLIEADDGLPGFPGFANIANQFTEPEATPAGLWWITHYWGRLSWDVLRSADDVVVGKTVQAILPATGEVAA